MSIIAGVLERKVWVRSLKKNLYPNLYVLLVGGAGVGKTNIVREVEYFWNEIPGLHVSPTSITKAALIDALFAAHRRVIHPMDAKPFTEFHSLLVAASEFSVLCPMYDTDFMGVLNDIYDCGPQFKELRRGRKEGTHIINPQLNIIACTTPSYLGTFLPEGAWSQGFMSRTVMIYSGEIVRPPLFEESIEDAIMREKLLHDLREISTAFGVMQWDKEAAERMQAWYSSGGEPQPEHPKLESYIARRHTNLEKLCTIVSISKSNSMIITVEDFSEALDLLVEAEFYMADVFKAITAGGDGLAIDDTWHFVWEIWSKEKKPVMEHRIVHFLRNRVPAHSIMRVLEALVRSNMLEIVEVSDRGRNAYKPTPKVTHST